MEGAPPLTRPDPILKPTTDHAEIVETRERLKNEESLAEEARRHESDINEALDGVHVPGEDDDVAKDPARQGFDKARVRNPLL